MVRHLVFVLCFSHLLEHFLSRHCAEFRYYVKENYPSILEAYYQLGETLGGDKSIRTYDDNVWQQEQQQAAKK